MKVRMVTLMAGPDGVITPGSEIDVADVVGVAMIAQGYAVALPSTGYGAGAGSGAARPHLAGVEHAVDVHAGHAEQRTNWGEALVTEIDGIGAVTAGLLADGGIETMAELLAVDTPMLAMLARVSPAKAEKWRQRAQAVMEQR